MLWFGLALLAAFSESLKSLFIKQGLRSTPSFVTALAASAFALPIVLTYFLFTSKIPLIGPRFIEALMWSGLLNVIALIQLMRALQSSDLSLTAPFITFTPIFLLLTSPWLVGEFPGLPGVLGVLLIVGGSYILAIHNSHISLADPFFAMWKEKGPRRMLMVAAIYSVTSNFDKIGVQHSSPLFWSVSINAFMVAGLLTIWFFMRRTAKGHYEAHQYGLLILIGLFSAITLVTHNMAMNLASVSAVVAVKRTSVLFAVLWGFFILRETSIRQRLTGTALMVLGIGLVAFDESI